MDLQLEDRSVIIAGGSGPIGSALTRAFRAEGADVLVGLSVEADEPVGADTSHIRIDLGLKAGADDLAAAALRTYGHIDLLINNVGPIVLRPGGFLHTSEVDIGEAVASNLLIPWRTCQAVLPIMVEQHGGTIINLASVAAQQPVGQLVHYSAAKAALVNMSKALAQEFAPSGIRVNVISPAPVASRGAPPVLDFAYPSGRPNTPDEVAALVALVASPRLANLTGINCRIDGGLVPSVF